MPELPEVEVSARIAHRALESKEITHVRLTPCKVFRLPRANYLKKGTRLPSGTTLVTEVDELKEKLIGAQAQTFLTSRHGKLMAFHLLTTDQSVLTLFSRLGMTGKYVREPIDDVMQSSERSGVKLEIITRPISSQTDDLERLIFINTRMFLFFARNCRQQLT